MKIALDAMGGDNAPGAVLEGARDSLRKNSGISRLFLVGISDQLTDGCRRANLDDPRVEIVEAPEVIEMHEPGAKAIRRKKHSSISIATGSW